MTNQQSNAVKHPPRDPSADQIQLESWQREVGASRAAVQLNDKAAKGTLAQRVANLYILQVTKQWEKSRFIPGQGAHIWALMPGRKAVEHVALESLCYVLGNLEDGRTFNQIASILGQRAEYVLFLLHPKWRRSYHLEGLRLATCDLGMKWVAKRLKKLGGDAYQPLTHAERAALGGLFLEIMAASTGLISIGVETTGRQRRAKVLRFTSLYWSFMTRWKQAASLFRPLHMPMLVEPLPWTRFDDGGYLNIRTGISSVDWERWPEIIQRAQPCVLRSINYLQAQPYQIDHQQMQLVETVWNLGHQIGSLPPQTRAEKPLREDKHPDYWPRLYAYKVSRMQDTARTRVVHSFVSYRQVEDAERLYWVQHMDHRGRLYPRGSQINVQGPDHIRSVIQFEQRSPIKGHEFQFAWSLGEALGTKPDWEDRKNYLSLMSTVIARVGDDPLGNKGLWLEAKEPWRFIQLARDWAGYLADPGYTSGTIHWRDQTCSGWGHVACLTADAQLARFTNVIGGAPADLYVGIGKLVESRIRWLNENLTEDDTQSSQLRCLAWWRKHQIPRSVWKKALMPLIYGRSYVSLSDGIKDYLRNEIKDFLTDENLRIVELGNVLASVINDVCKEAVPHAKSLAKWLGDLARMQVDAGKRPYWFTPNGMAVESWSSDTKARSVKLELAKTTVSVALRDATNCEVHRAKSAKKLVPDYIHSMDAAFLQRFVAHWEAYQHPIATVHDCFGTTLENVGTMQQELCDQWHRFYSVDWLTRHQGMVETVLGHEVPAPPIVGTLDRGQIGENPNLFG